MKSFLKFILWTLVFVAIIAALDQAAVRLEPRQPVFKVARGFYLDLRTRLLRLAGMRERSIEEIIERSGPLPKPPEFVSVPAEKPEAPVAPTPLPRAEEVKKTQTSDSPRYLYIDASGRLQFADSLEEVPESLRSGARAMER